MVMGVDYTTKLGYGVKVLSIDGDESMNPCERSKDCNIDDVLNYLTERVGRRQLCVMETGAGSYGGKANFFLVDSISALTTRNGGCRQVPVESPGGYAEQLDAFCALNPHIKVGLPGWWLGLEVW